MHPGLAVAAVAGLYYLLKPTKFKVFISYDHSEDVGLRNLLEAWNSNSQFEFSMDRTSPFERINSEDDAVVKRALTRKLKEADYLLVIVGEKTHTSWFVEWEIERAMAEDINLKIAAVKKHPRCKLPKILKGNASISDRFTRDGVIKALENAKEIH